MTAAADVAFETRVSRTAERPVVAPGSVALFQQPWWLDAVAPGRWAAARVVRDDEIVGYWPYLSQGVPGLAFSPQPPLTPALGPWILPADNEYRQTLAAEHAVLAELISALPHFDYLHQRCSPTLSNGLPFVWAGFDVRVGYTYRLTDPDDLDGVWAGFETQRRRAVRKAQRTLEVVEDTDLESLLRLCELTFRRAGTRTPYRQETVRRIDRACRTRDASSALVARDLDGAPRAAVYLVHDEHTTYYLLGGADDEGRANGAMTLLLWEGIRRAAARGTVFDFEGSMIETVERFFRSFGAQQVPYLVVSRSTARARPIVPLARIARRVAGGLSWRHS